MRLIDADKLIEDVRKNSVSYFADDFAREWVDKQPTIEPEQRWIPCSERLPDNEDKVLCCTKTKRGLYNLVIGYYMASHGWVCGMNNNVTAWAPLPEPYKEQK